LSYPVECYLHPHRRNRLSSGIGLRDHEKLVAMSLGARKKRLDGSGYFIWVGGAFPAQEDGDSRERTSTKRWVPVIRVEGRRRSPFIQAENFVEGGGPSAAPASRS